MPGDRVLVGHYGPDGKKSEKAQFGQAVVVSERPENDRRSTEKHLRKIFGVQVGDKRSQNAIKKLLKGGWSIKSGSSAEILKLIPKDAAEVRAAVEENFEQVKEAALKRKEEKGSAEKKTIKERGVGDSVEEIEEREIDEYGIGRETLKTLLGKVIQVGNMRLRKLEGIDPQDESVDAALSQEYVLSIDNFIDSEKLSSEERIELLAEVDGYNAKIEKIHNSKRDEREAWLVMRQEEADRAGAAPEKEPVAEGDTVATQQPGSGPQTKEAVATPEPPKRQRKSPEESVFGRHVVESWDKKLYKSDGFWMVIRDLHVGRKLAMVEFGNPMGGSKKEEVSQARLKKYLLEYSLAESPLKPELREEDVFGKHVVESLDKKLYKSDGFWMVIRYFHVGRKLAMVEFGNPMGGSKKKEVSQAELDEYLKNYSLADNPLKPEPELEIQEPGKDEAVGQAMEQEFAEILRKNLFAENGDWIYVSRILEKDGKIEIAKGASGKKRRRFSRVTPEQLREYLNTFRLPIPETGAGVPEQELPEPKTASPEPQGEPAEKEAAAKKAEQALSPDQALAQLSKDIESDGQKILRKVERINPDSDMSEQHLGKDYRMSLAASLARLKKEHKVNDIPIGDLVACKEIILSFNQEISMLLERKRAERKSVVAKRSPEKQAGEPGEAVDIPKAELIMQKFQQRLMLSLNYVRSFDFASRESEEELKKEVLDEARIHTDIHGILDLNLEERTKIIQSVIRMNAEIEKEYRHKLELWKASRQKKMNPPVDQAEPVPAASANPADQAKPSGTEADQKDAAPAAEPVREQEPVSSHPKPPEIFEGEIVEETDIEKVQREVDEARTRYVRANRKSTSLVSKLKKFFGVSAKVPESDDAAARYLEMYQEKSRQLLRLKMDEIKKSWSPAESMRKQIQETVKYFTFDEKIKLYEAGNDARAEEVEKRFGKWPGTMTKKFLSFINGYRKLGWKKKMFFSTALFASGAGLAVQGVYRAFTSTAAAVGAGGMYEAWQRRKDAKELEAEQARVKAESEKIANPEERYARVMEMLSARIGQYDQSLSQQKKRRWGKWTVGVGMGIGAFFFGPKIFQGIRDFFGDSIGTAPTPGEAEIQGTGTKYPDTEALERSFNEKLGQDWGAGHELEYNHKIMQGASGSALNYEPEFQRPSLMTPDEIDQRIQGMLSGGQTLEVTGHGSSIESTLISHLKEAGMPEERIGTVAHKMVLNYADENKLDLGKLDLVHEGAEIRLSPDGAKIISVIDSQDNAFARVGEAAQSDNIGIPQAEAGSFQVSPGAESESGTQFSQDLMGPGEPDAMQTEPDIRTPDQAPDNLPELGDLDAGSIKSINEALASHKDGWVGDEYAMVQRDLEVSQVINKCLANGDLAAWKAGKDAVMEDVLANPHGSALAQQVSRLHDHFMDLADKQTGIAQQIRKALEARPNETLESWTGRLSITTRMLNIDKI